MINDALLAFVPIGAPLSMVAAAGVSVPSGIIDLLGIGVGVAPTSIIGTPSTFGAPDAMGVGGMRPELNVAIGTAFTTGTSATLNLALQAAPDTAVTFQPGTWQTIEETGPLTAAQLTANTIIMRLPWVPPFPFNLRPRYLRLLGQTPSGTLFTAGTIAYATVVSVRDDLYNLQAAKNFVAS